MDTLTSYQKIVRDLILEYAQYKPSHGEIETEVIIDTQNDHYELLHVGWDGVRRVHGAVIHIDIIDGKVWIQHDGTSPGVAHDLAQTGIPREDIILGFRPAHLRQYTEFGVA
jgi:hypothetical protein